MGETNLVIGKFLAGPPWSPLIVCSSLQVFTTTSSLIEVGTFSLLILCSISWRRLWEGRFVVLQFVFLRKKAKWFEPDQELPARAIRRVGML